MVGLARGMVLPGGTDGAWRQRVLARPPSRGDRPCERLTAAGGKLTVWQSHWSRSRTARAKLPYGQRESVAKHAPIGRHGAPQALTRAGRCPLRGALAGDRAAVADP